MMSMAMLFSAAVLCAAWGLAHLVPTTRIIAAFGSITVENRRLLAMEWIAEGLTLIFLGGLVALVTRSVAVETSARLVVRTSAGMLVALAVLSLMTGARTSALPMRLCPVVKLVTAGLLVVGSLG